MKKQNHSSSENERPAENKPVLRGELALIFAVIINSLGVSLCSIPVRESLLFPAYPSLFPRYCHTCLWAHGLTFFRDF